MLPERGTFYPSSTSRCVSRTRGTALGDEAVREIDIRLRVATYVLSLPSDPVLLP